MKGVKLEEEQRKTKKASSVADHARRIRLRESSGEAQVREIAQAYGRRQSQEQSSHMEKGTKRHKFMNTAE
jgi:hypothetical protein